MFIQEDKLIKKINEYGTIHYYNNKGELHRLDGPAIINTVGDKYWYKNQLLHREDGPAVEYNNGHKEWCLNGYRHREDGPAVEYYDGSKSWYIEGKKYFEEDYLEKIEEMKRNGTYNL